MPGPNTPFQCLGASCNECCKVAEPVPGAKYTRVTDAEIVAMASHLGVDEASFRASVIHPDGDALLVDEGTGVCKLWSQGQGCTVHPVKPDQCVKFPNDPSVAGDKQKAIMASNRCPQFKFPYHWYPRR